MNALIRWGKFNLVGALRVVGRERIDRSTSQSTQEVSSACHATMGQGVRFQWKGKMPSE